MEFHVNHPALYIMTGLLVAVVLAQSVFFLVKALRRSKAIGMDQTKIKKTIKTAAIFTIAPAVAIVISVMTLSKKLGRGVRIVNGKRKGRFELDFYGQEDLQVLLDLLMKLKK